MEDALALGLAPTLPVGLPDDWVFDRDLPCPKCRYNLRMLRLPRCPECGTLSRWQELLHVNCPRCGQSLEAVNGTHCPRCVLELNWELLLRDAAPLHRDLYEYSDRPLLAAMKTSLAVLLPRRFWRRIPLEAPPAGRRLALYHRTAWTLAILGCLIALWFGSVTWGLHTWAIACGAVLGLPLLTRLALPRFTPTLARFNVRRDQLHRCFVYASTGIGWIGATFGIVLGAWVVAFGPRAWWWSGWDGVGSVLNFPRVVEALLSWPWARSTPTVWVQAAVGGIYWSLGFLWWWRFLYVSLRHYLRLNAVNAFALFLSTQTIAILLLLLAGALSTILGYYLDFL